MIRGGVTKALGWCLLAGSAWAAGCGGKSEDGGGNASVATGGKSSWAMGGRSASSSMPTAGSPVTASGGAIALGGAQGTTGGSVGIGGSASTGASAAIGGAIPNGGNSIVGGASPNGGAIPNGGNSVVGGASPASGKSATGGAAPTGGSVGTGGASPMGGASSTAGSASGDPLAAFCKGTQSKVLYQGMQEVLAPATDYISGRVMNCCWVDGVNLHTRATLGFDIEVETIWSGGVSAAPSVTTLGEASARVRAEARRSTDSAAFGVRAEGTLAVISANPLDVGLCLSVYATATALYNTFIYVPKVSLSSNANRARFQIFLLSDSSIGQSQAIAQGLNAVPLATNPILDLTRIAYISSSANEIGFNPGQKIGDTLQAALAGSLVLGIPFVIVAEGERIALGAFMSGVSSISYGLPTIMVESITSDWLVIENGTGSTNPLKDSRCVTTLTATGKLIP